ncbi:hypothetical protein [Flavobacterium anhuiense]|uniref:hypothetical protein n=1 Tax=Flavobacterium anhuiense TaxID=459526 RepID=UPI0034D95287
MIKKILLSLVFVVQISIAQETSYVGKLRIGNDGVYNTTFDSGGVSRMHMGYDGATGYVKFGAHTGGGQKEDILYMRGSDGNVGIGTSLPSALLDVYTPVLNQTTYNTQKWSTGNNDYNLTLQTIWNSNGINQRFVQLYNGINYNSLVFFAGNVGIGKDNPSNKLDVNGTIHSKEVKVDMTGWSDFVFKKEYNLPTLEEVEKHIAEKGHLENIPSEEEVLKNGINLGEMNAKLLQKIEELTLYMIEMKKENEEIKIENKKQNEKIMRLESKLILK